MEGISDIRISGIDETRPPRVRKEPYINLYFKLNHKAPKEWCEDFNRLVSKKKFPAKVDPLIGLYIDTWVRKPEEVDPAFEGLKLAVKVCSEEYVERIREQARKDEANASSNLDDEGEQGRLNRIIAGLKFDD